jgi:hypothetical protein
MKKDVMTYKVLIALPESMKKEIRIAAAIEDLSVADWIRKKLLDGMPPTGSDEI